MVLAPDPEVPEKKPRRKHTAKYKLRILAQADVCTEPGQIGALLRREGLYSSNLTAWRRQKEKGLLQAMAHRKRGRRRKEKNPLADKVAQLEREKRLLQQRLKKAETIIEVQKKNFRDPVNLSESGRQRKQQLMNAALELGNDIGQKPACEALLVPRATLYRCLGAKKTPNENTSQRPTPPLSLCPEERQTVIEILHCQRFLDDTPYQIYAALLDEGQYYCSIRTMYRILTAEHGWVKERRNHVQRPNYTKPELLATAPNQVWSWDITKLKGPAKWTYFYLYVILDIFSRYVVGWMVAHREQDALAKRLIEESCRKQQIKADQLTIHADRGSSMKSNVVAHLLADLGVTKTHSRPHVSNDNPYSEAQFKTLKYCPQFPDSFGSIQGARSFRQPFFNWYNKEHRHSGIALMTPEQVHCGMDKTIYQNRSEVLAVAFKKNPNRFKGKLPIPKSLPPAAWINKPATDELESNFRAPDLA
ncbi:MAG: IS3 family transposase [Chloroflexota bacterium]